VSGDGQVFASGISIAIARSFVKGTPAYEHSGSLDRFNLRSPPSYSRTRTGIFALREQLLQANEAETIFRKGSAGSVAVEVSEGIAH